MGEPACPVCAEPIDAEVATYCRGCWAERGETWFEWDGVPFLLDAALRAGVVAVLELLDDAGRVFRCPLYVGGEILRKPRAVFLGPGTFEAARDYLAEHGGRVTWV